MFLKGNIIYNIIPNKSNLFSSSFVVPPHCAQTDVILNAAKRRQNMLYIFKISNLCHFKLLTPLLFLMLIMSGSGCSSLQSSENSSDRITGPKNLFNIPAQIVTDSSIHSIQFHRAGNPYSAPILNLDSNDQLLLRFEHLSIESKQFQVSLSHHNPDWNRSGLPPEQFMNGFFNLTFGSGEVSSNTRPNYRQYSFTFPSEQFQITKSGNYLLKVEDADTGFIVMNLPFFVTENAGSITSSVEELSRQNLRRVERPVSQFSLPDFVDQPQFDLEFYFAQNEFWGRAKQADELDFSAPDHVQFELSTNDAFISDYEFRALSLNDLSQRDNNVVEAFPSEIPPRLILRDDAAGFGASGSINLAQMGPYGNPDMSLRAGYADVVFRFDTDEALDSTQSIHLLGDFNNWSLNSSNKLQFDDQVGRWTTNQIIKKGSYKYKYVLVDGNEIDDLYFDQNFVDNRQQYHAFVYMRDSKNFYYRLLQVQSFFPE